MGFFEEFPVEGGGTFVSAEEKADLVANRTGFTITGVQFREKDKYGSRYVLDIVLDGEERKIGFPAGTVDSRDRQLGNMAQYLAAGNKEVGPVAIELSEPSASGSQSQLIVPA